MFWQLQTSEYHGSTKSPLSVFARILHSGGVGMCRFGLPTSGVFRNVSPCTKLLLQLSTFCFVCLKNVWDMFCQLASRHSRLKRFGMQELCVNTCRILASLSLRTLRTCSSAQKTIRELPRAATVSHHGGFALKVHGHLQPRLAQAIATFKLNLRW